MYSKKCVARFLAQLRKHNGCFLKRWYRLISRMQKYRLSRIKDSKEDKKEIGIKVEFPGVQLIVCKPYHHTLKKKTQKKRNK